MVPGGTDAHDFPIRQQCKTHILPHIYYAVPLTTGVIVDQCFIRVVSHEMTIESSNFQPVCCEWFGSVPEELGGGSLKATGGCEPPPPPGP